jgi:hypothetical protein
MDISLENIGRNIKNKKKPIGIGIIIVALLGTVVAISTYTQWGGILSDERGDTTDFSWLFFQPPSGESQAGYANFTLVDPRTNELMNGTIAIISQSNTSALVSLSGSNPVATGTPVLLPANVYAVINTVYNTTEDYMPATIVPRTTSSQPSPGQNEFLIPFLTNATNVSCSCVEKNGTPGSYNETDIPENLETILKLNISVNYTTTYHLFGQHGYCPDLNITTLNDYYNISGYGLYFLLNDTALTLTESIECNNVPTLGFNMAERNQSAILLDTVFGATLNQTITFTVNATPSAIELGWGFIENWDEYYVQITS